jgi:hypothetical protein
MAIHQNADQAASVPSTRRDFMTRTAPAAAALATTGAAVPLPAVAATEVDPALTRLEALYTEWRRLIRERDRLGNLEEQIADRLLADRPTQIPRPEPPEEIACS